MAADLYNTRTLILNEGSPDDKRMEILQYFRKTFAIDEQLYEALANEEAFYKRADPLRHPIIFYLGHTAVFFINKLVLSKIISTRINPVFESTFAVGVDEMSWDDLNMEHYDWPTVAEVREYRQQVRELIEAVILQMPIDMPIGWNSPAWVILMGIEHIRIHLETSSVLIRQLPLTDLKPILDWEICPTAGVAPDNELLSVDGATVAIGKSPRSPLYGWDNEYGKHEVNVKGFKASKFLCSNGEFLRFIEDKGYETKEFWTEEGWAWLSYERAKHPRFWRRNETGWKLRLVFNEIEMPWNWPVEVNQLEAKAFCNWKMKKSNSPIRLPAEEEWLLLRDMAEIEDQPYWKKAPGNVNMEHFQSPCPVNQFSFGAFYDLIGNVWQWTETPISGFKGFTVHPFYDDFSTPTFDLRHNLIKGGSWISTGNEATRDARYAFRRHFYQHAGFRYVESENPVVIKEEVYETDPEVVRNCDAQYGAHEFARNNFYKAIADFCRTIRKPKADSRALDLGCKVGRSTFELAKSYSFVQGLDFTARNIRVAIELQEKGYVQYIFPEEGDLICYPQILLSRLGLDDFRAIVNFMQGDPSNLKEIYSGYDLILVNDILDEMYDPITFLKSIDQRLNEGGLLVIASAFDWDETLTPRNKWIGGFREDGEPVSGPDALYRLLTDKFEKHDEIISLPVYYRENKRKFTLKQVDISVWEKR